MTSNESPKRMRLSSSSKSVTSDPNAEWAIEFEDVASLRAVVDAAAAIELKRVMFKVALVSGNYFLMLDGRDHGNTCFVSARLKLDNVWIKDDSQDFTFCVESSHLLYSIDNPSMAHGTLLLTGVGDGVNVTLHDTDPNYDEESKLPTFVDSDDMPEVETLDFDTQLEMDVPKLQNIFKKAQKFKAEHMRIRIFLEKKGMKHCSLVIFSIEGEAYHSQKFYHETSRHEDGSLIVHASPAAGDDKFEFSDKTPVYNHKFIISYVDAFIKKLPSRKVIARVQQGMPLLLYHNLGGDIDESSNVRFLLAPSLEDDGY